MIARLRARLAAMWLGPQLYTQLQHIVFFHDQLFEDDIEQAKALLARIPGDVA